LQKRADKARREADTARGLFLIAEGKRDRGIVVPASQLDKLSGAACGMKSGANLWHVI
jgi:hypothetical protein